MYKLISCEARYFTEALNKAIAEGFEIVQNTYVVTENLIGKYADYHNSETKVTILLFKAKTTNEA